MNIEVREDSVRITGYVNAVERLSKPITEQLHGRVRTFLEKIRAGVFRKALKRNEVKVLLNHDKNRILASTKDNTAILVEDNIGLRADVTIYDKEVIESARNNRLVGWSFGFYPNSDELGTDGQNEIRTVTDLDLDEVSILDDTKIPAYNGTSIYARSRENVLYRSMLIEDDNSNEETEESSNETLEDSTLETEERDEKIEILADKIAEKVVEKMAGADEKKTIPEESAEEDEKREFDYSSFEERISKLKRA